MIINASFDPSVSTAPAGFTAAVNYVVGLFEATFTNNVTINVSFGWGETNGKALQAGSLGESSTALTTNYTFSQISRALTAEAVLGDTVPANGLPASDPTNAGRFELATDEGRALGLRTAATATDGWVGLDSTAAFTFSPAASPGRYVAIGVIEHELTEVMGRTAGLSPGSYSALDLYRYSANGVLDVSGAAADYFSVDHGATNLANFSTDTSGDLGDLAAGAGPDPFLAYSARGQAAALTNLDLVTMAALGWVDTPTPTIVDLFETPHSGSMSSGQTITIGLAFNTDVTVSGAPTLTLSNGGVARYVGGSGSHGLTFQYVPAASSVVEPTASALNLNGGSITSPGGLAANVSLSAAGVSHYDAITTAAANASLTAANNTVVIVGANDTVTGGAGVNTADFTGSVAQYFLSQSVTTDTITDGLPSRDGVVTLRTMQQAQFSDVTLVFDLNSSQDLLVYELYQAAYARMPDNAGFRYWAGLADASHLSALALADQFLTAPEYVQKYGASPNASQYITELYTNVLGRAPDAAGLNYWIGQANAGQPRDQLLVDFATSSENVQLIASHTATGYWTT